MCEKMMILLAAVCGLNSPVPSQERPLVLVKVDQFPLRSGCSETDAIVARVRAGDRVEVKFALAGGAKPCYAVSVTIDGKAVQGYLPADALSGLEAFERSRRAAPAAVAPPGAAASKPPPPLGTSRRQVGLEITEDEGNYVLTVPVSQLVMTIPKGGLARARNPFGGSGDSPRYFYLEDKALHLVVSGWFESDQAFPGIKQFWAGEMAAWKRQNLPEAEHVLFEKLGAWNAIIYDSALRAERSSHIRAHWIQAGTWIDIHLSLTAGLPATELRDKLRDLLRRIQVSEKKP